jgi:hypothetical protein
MMMRHKNRSPGEVRNAEGPEQSVPGEAGVKGTPQQWGVLAFVAFAIAGPWLFGDHVSPEWAAVLLSTGTGLLVALLVERAVARRRGLRPKWLRKGR